ncbi:MAG: BamA/TamA family outer membrane protein, partial [Myxococcota bacterium]
EGRKIALSAAIETDRDREWFGIGNDTIFDDRRTVKDETLSAQFEIDLTPRDSKRFFGVLRTGYLRQTLNPGEGPRAPPVGGDPDVVVPPGFEQSLDYASAGVELTLSSVDSVGRPTRGGLLQLETTAATEFDRGDLSAWITEVRAVRYLRVLPRNRVLAFKGGASASVPLREGDSVPFAQLVNYGGNDILRGYRRGRWRDEWGWWGALEYSFPIYDFGGLGFELAPTFFFDVGRVGPEFDELFEGPVRYSGGVGVRASHDLFFAFQVSLGFSPDGAQFNLDLGEAFF